MNQNEVTTIHYFWHKSADSTVTRNEFDPYFVSDPSLEVAGESC